MRTFVILACLLAVCQAASLGYEYEQNNAGQAGEVGFEHGAQQLSQPIEHSSEFVKEFFTYSAPEGDFSQGADDNQFADSLKKNLRVIFIKGPESSGLENAALSLAKSATDDRTAIYVLTKQTDVGDLANKLNSINQNHASKPEVHFVKYRTQADAENAQRTIQSQYDSLGGHSTSHNGGVAPVLNFASQGPAHSGGSGSSHIGGSTSNAAIGSNTYLPPQRRA